MKDAVVEVQSQPRHPTGFVQYCTNYGTNRTFRVDTLVVEDLHRLPRHRTVEARAQYEGTAVVALGSRAVTSLARGFQDGQCFIYACCCPRLGREDASHDPILVNNEAYTASEQSKGLLHTIGSSNRPVGVAEQDEG